MTRRKINPKVQGAAYVHRKHYACLLREDLVSELKKACERLNCSQGVFLEVALSKILLGDIVKPHDVFAYDAGRRWFEAARARLVAGLDWQGKQITEEERAKMVALFSRVIAGEVPVDADILQEYRKRGFGASVALHEYLFTGTQEIPVASRPALRKKDLRKISKK